MFVKNDQKKFSNSFFETPILDLGSILGANLLNGVFFQLVSAFLRKYFVLCNPRIDV